MQSFAFSFFGAPVKVPEQKEYVIYSKQIESKPLPDTENGDISTTLLVYNIQTQASTSTEMFYLKVIVFIHFKIALGRCRYQKCLL